MVLYRLYPKRYSFLFRALRTAFFVSVISTTIEIGVVLWFYIGLFRRWSTLNKVLTPMLFTAFVSAQIWSAICLWRIGNSKRSLMKGESGGVEAGVIEETVASEEEDKKNSK